MNNIPRQQGPQQEEPFPRVLRHQGQMISESIYNYLYTEKPTYLLWIVASWAIMGLNIAFVFISIVDMWKLGYNAGMHWISSAVIVATIGGLMIIHEKVIRPKQEKEQKVSPNGS